MSWIPAAIGAVAGLIGGKDAGKSQTTKTELDPWTKGNIDEWEGYYKNSPVPQVDLDNLTADLNPWQIETLSDIANYSSGAGQDQVNMMNLMGLNQAGVGDALSALAQDQASMGKEYTQGGGDFIMEALRDFSGGGSGSPSIVQSYGGGGGGAGGPLKFEYDQGTYDQIMSNLSGLAQNSFDAYSSNAKNDALFNQGAGLQMGQALLGGANTKVGQQSALLDAMTNRDIINYGAQMNQWAGEQANAGAMSAGTNNLSSATSIAQSSISAAASRANAAMAAKANMFASAMSGASNLMGYGVNMMSDANTSYTNAGSVYGAAGDTFGNANTTSLANMDGSMAAGNYLLNYDQAALDRYNNALVFNQSAPGEYALAGLNAMSGVPYGRSTTSPGLNAAQQVGTAIGVGEKAYGLINQLPIFSGSGSSAPTTTISGGAGGGIGFSDIRLKKNIEFIGKKGDINIYKWDWNDAAKKTDAPLGLPVGVLAQEMLSVRPEAVIQNHPSGYLCVDYSKIPEMRGV